MGLMYGDIRLGFLCLVINFSCDIGSIKKNVKDPFHFFAVFLNTHSGLSFLSCCSSFSEKIKNFGGIKAAK